MPVTLRIAFDDQEKPEKLAPAHYKYLNRFSRLLKKSLNDVR